MLKTAEFISPNHPDKICDRISDAILDYCLLKDKYSRVAIETMGGHNKVYLTGEISSNFNLDFNIIEEIVYRISNIKDVSINIEKQSNFIAQGVDSGGAGDQGIANGYACRDNEEFMPQELYLARNLCKFIYNKYPYDGKTQITINENKKIVSLIASFQNTSKDKLKELIDSWLVNKNVSENIEIFLNPAGDWTLGGFDADTGLTGRKIVCDNYGPNVPVGGGAFSGKDATKVDRSGAYIARKIALDILKENKNFNEVFVQLAYSIGIKNPISITCFVDKKEILSPEINLSISDVIERLKLREPIFEKVSQWGSFGNGFIWDN